MSPSRSQQQREDAMQQVYVSDKGDDKNDGLSLEAPIKSLKPSLRPLEWSRVGANGRS